MNFEGINMYCIGNGFELRSCGLDGLWILKNVI